MNENKARSSGKLNKPAKGSWLGIVILISGLQSIIPSALRAETTFNLSITHDMLDPFYNSSNPIYTGINNLGIGLTGGMERLEVYGDIRIGGQATTATGTVTPQAMLSLFDYNYGIGKFSGTPVGTRVFSGIGTNLAFGVVSPTIPWPYIGITGSPYTHVESNFIAHVTITTAGSIGIGTTTPSNILTVGGGGRLRIANNNTDYSVIGTDQSLSYYNSRIQISGTSSGSGSGNIQYYALYPTTGSTTDGNHIWYTATGTGVAGTPVERMRLTQAGLLGLGTTTPSAPLTFPLSLLGDKAVLLGSTTANAGIGLANIGSSSPLFQIHSGSTTSDIVFGTGSSTSFGEKARIRTLTGYVGIGTASPSYPLHIATSSIPTGLAYAYYARNLTVVSTGYASSGTSGSNGVSIYAAARVVAVQFAATSDRRLKEDIVTIPEERTLRFIHDARPVYFKWKGSNAHQYGFIAQDLIRLGLQELVLPALDQENSLLTQTIDDDGLTSPQGIKLTVNYDQLTALLAHSAQILYKKENQLLTLAEELDPILAHRPKPYELSVLHANQQEVKKSLQELQERLSALEKF